MGSLAEPTSGYVDFKAVGSAALGALDVMVPRILLGGYRKGRERIVPNPTRNNATPGSFSINLQTGIWAEFATGATGSDGGGRGAGDHGADHGDGVGRGDADGGRRGGGVGGDLGDDDSCGDGNDCGGDGGGLGRGVRDGVVGGGRGGNRGRDSGAGGGGHHGHDGGGGRASGRGGAGPGDDFGGSDSRRRDGGGGGLGCSSGDAGARAIGRAGGGSGGGRGGHGGAQTIFSGSVRESGEDIKWARDGEPARADAPPYTPNEFLKFVTDVTSMPGALDPTAIAALGGCPSGFMSATRHPSPPAPARRLTMSVDLTIAGRRFGYLVIAYGRRHDITCRCICDRLVHIAAEALTNGTVTCCGCQPAPRAFWIQHRELRAQSRREIQFKIGRGQ
jgi:hypothetical protein